MVPNELSDPSTSPAYGTREQTSALLSPKSTAPLGKAAVYRERRRSSIPYVADAPAFVRWP